MNNIKNNPEEIIKNTSLSFLLDERARLDDMRSKESSIIKKMRISKEIKKIDRKIMSSTNLKRK